MRIALVALALVSLGAAPAGRGRPRPRPKASATAEATATPPALDCEAVKTRVVAASKLCPEASHEASTIACSATGHARLLMLDLECTRQSSPDAAKKSPLATELDSSSCRALSVKDGSVLAEATVPDYQGCMRAVQSDVVAKKCSAGTKEVEYLFLRGSHDPYVFTVRCP